MSALEVQDLVVDYAGRGVPRFRAVDHVSFSMNQGETLALVGESGSGKSTIVRAIAQLTKVTSGRILLDGKDAPRHGRGLRRYRGEVQVVFQDPFASLNPSFSVGHHVRRPLIIHGTRRGEVEAEVRRLLETVSLTPAADVAKKFPHELSGGQRQRVAIARAVAPDPAVLLADEPVSMLDVSIRLEIMNLLDRMKRDRRLALLYVTHDLATARHFSTNIMVMYRGEIVERGTADDVILRPKHPYTRLLAESAPSRAATARRKTIIDAKPAQRERRDAPVGDGCKFRPRCPFAMEICKTRPPEFETGNGQTAKCWLFDPDRASAPEEGAAAA
ncbi:ATP-binding cassette domain-containing protein [Pseudolysinimonas kribbensis]|uniref:ABC transporter ATP-binding protein n=1 Tax=Pseudolysinimonas kribbensis TaxID=433641 RepID=UPI0031D5771F